MTSHRWWATALIVALTWPLPGLAQQPADTTARRQQRQLDSLAAVIRALQARMDSLARRGVAPDSGGDELAALRAAAVAAGAGEGGDTARAAAPGAQRLGQNALNPEISVTGDLRASAYRPGPQSNSFDAREYEFAFQSALDPFASAKVFISVAGEDVGVEEGYAYFPVLPGHVRLDVGRFRQQVGELNRWHLHAVDGDEYPRVIREYTGPDGLTGTGVSLYWPVPVPSSLGTIELTVQGTVGSNDVLFAGGDRPAATAQLAGFWQLSRATYVMASVSGGYGTNPAAVSPLDTTRTGLTTRLGVLAGRFTWRPPSRATAREFTLRGELWSLQRRWDGAGPVRYGWYTDADWRLDRRFTVGTRFDRLAAADPAVTGRGWAVTPSLTFWQSEFVYLRALWEHSRDFAGATGDRFTLRAVFAMGPHKHELF